MRPLRAWQHLPDAAKSSDCGLMCIGNIYSGEDAHNYQRYFHSITEPSKFEIVVVPKLVLPGYFGMVNLVETIVLSTLYFILIF